MPSKINTSQGQAWDQLAKEYLGGEVQMHRLLAGNWRLLGIVLFSGDIEIELPEKSGTEAKVPVQSLPPWKG